MLGLVFTFVIGQAAPGANPYVEQARAAYKDFDYAGCLKASELAGRLEREPAAQASIEVLHAMCALELGRKAEAAERLELALRIDPSAKLPSVVSPKIEAMFQSIRDRLGPLPPRAETAKVEEAPEATPAKVEEPALPPRTEVAEAPSETKARRSWVAPVLLGAAGVASVAVGGAFGFIARDAAAANRSATFSSDIDAFGAKARSAALGANVGFAIAGALAVAAIVAWLVEL